MAYGKEARDMSADLIQLVEVSRHQTDQLTGADLIQDSAGQLQGLFKGGGGQDKSK